ncbi:MAG TPA: two-component system response regulator RppA [Candidatus Aquicultor sp.]|jgi:heavy metal response regulator
MRILVVEDEEKLANILKEGLAQEGFAVDCIFDGESGWYQIDMCRDEYDLIVLDVMLPKLDGFKVCENIRRQGISVPILMLTARDSMEDKVHGLDCGADDYLVKPFAFEELLARVRALLRRPNAVLPPQLRIKDLVLNPITKKVYRGEKEIVLTMKEFALLEYLMRNAGQVLTREQVISRLWDFNFDSFSNVIDVHIKNLRKKIDHEYQDKLLETIRGAGYRLRT